MATRDEPAGRLADISTHWSVLEGPPRAALDYLYRVYGRAILAYIRGRLGRGDLRPLAPDDAEDEPDAELAARLGKSLESFRSLLKRARFSASWATSVWSCAERSRSA
jgi:hypothetical protein